LHFAPSFSATIFFLISSTVIPNPFTTPFNSYSKLAFGTISPAGTPFVPAKSTITHLPLVFPSSYIPLGVLGNTLPTTHPRPTPRPPPRTLPPPPLDRQLRQPVAA